MRSINNFWRNSLPIQKAVAFLTIAAFAFMPFASVEWVFAADPIHNSASLRQWSDIGNSWQNGNLHNGNSNYSEGEVLPYQLELPSNHITAGEQYSFSVCRDYENGSIKGFLTLEQFDTDRAASPGGTVTSINGPFSGVNVTIDTVVEVGSQGACGSNTRETQVTITVDDENNAFVLWGGYLASPSDGGVGIGNGASEWPGASLHMKLLSPNKDRSIQASAITPEEPDTETGTIMIEKVVTGDGADADLDFEFDVSWSATNLFTSENGPAVGSTTLAVGSYTIDEINIPTNWANVGVSCTGGADVETATSTATIVLSADENVVCTFTNEYTEPIVPPPPTATSTLTLVKVVDNTGGGTATTTDWTLSATMGTTTISGVTGTSTITGAVVEVGVYTLSEDGPTGYDASDWVCSNDGGTEFTLVDGELTLEEGDDVVCTITNTYVVPDPTLGSLKVVKNTVNGNGTFGFSGSGGIGNFNITTVAGTGSSTIMNLTPGTYSITETSLPANWSETSNDCVDVLVEAEQEATCTITNTFTAPPPPSGGGGGTGNIINPGGSTQGGQVLGDSTVVEVVSLPVSTGVVLGETIGLPATGAGGNASTNSLPMLLVLAIGALAFARRQVVIAE